MKRLGLLLLIAACGCGGPAQTGIADFQGTWAGTITETYYCTQSMPPAFQLTEALGITQNGPNVSIVVSSCNNLLLSGNAAGDSVNITPSSTGQLCQQQDSAGDTISIDEFTGGTLNLTTGTTLDVLLNENATINGDSCTGQATGTLVLQ